MLSAIRRRGRQILILVTLILLGVLVHTAWPFVTYPVTHLSYSTSTPLPADEIQVPMAGVAEVDITPAIGIPKFGYSAFATKANGFRTRLKARAFYLQGPGGTPMALVQLDLGSGSRVLHREVAALIAATTDVPAHGLSLLSTHTHTGPGSFLGSDFYNAFGANQPGFDPVLFRFLSERIALAVRIAYESRRPARLATGVSEAWGMTRNRSLPAWARNHGIAEDELTADMVFAAVNPAMHMLRIDLQADNGCFYPAGALTTYSIHGTAIPARWDPYHGDVWAAFSRALKSDYRASAGDCQEISPFGFVHGTVQATHGDNNPDVRGGQRGPIEARRIGESLGSRARALHQSLAARLQARLNSAIASRELALLNTPEPSPLCERAIVGAATAGGANDDEVFPISYLPYLKEGWGRSMFTDGCHAEKQWMASKLQSLLPAERMPHRAMLQVIRINDLVLAAVPWEVTFEAGIRIRAAIIEQLAGLEEPNLQVEITSVANGYLGYATTAEEYSAQYYEGGHTLYGPGTVSFLASRLAALAGEMVASGTINDLPDQTSFHLITRQYWPEPDERVAATGIRQQAQYMRAEANREPYWQIEVAAPGPGNLALHDPLVRVEVLEAGTWRLLESDEGLDLGWVLASETDSGASYHVRWFNPQHSDDKRHRFVITVNAQPPLFSEPF